ncbi:MAG TPA: FKBP-type peptidyl-prolyl cis-trans isomerase [Dongiaceae bacterium]|nr:FKBP-type peptidyl-prolyl cis-trans isomerase [Dongiaceae bacterium]
MYRTTLRTLTLSLAGTLLCGIAFAQSSAPASSQATASTTATPKAQKPATSTGATKTGTAATTAKKPATATPFTLKTQKDKASYAIGVNIGRSMKKDSVDVDPDVIARGLKDVFADKKLLLTDEEAQAALSTLKNDMQKKQQEEYQAAVDKNKKEGDAFLAVNKAKPGVVTTASGLQYKIVQEGTGPKPTAADTVVCNYKGTLVDGTEFDSSYKRGQPATFPVGQVIKGWTEALQLMPVGSKWEIVIPPSLGYGERGTPNGGPIGPNSTLIFEVELVSIQPKTPAPAAPSTQPQGQPQSQPQAEQPQAQPQQAAPQAKPQ